MITSGGVFPAQTEVSVGGSLAGWELILLVAVVAATILGFAWPFLRARARRLERPADADSTRLDGIEDRLRRLTEVEARLAELEQRVEFAERLLPKPASSSLQPTIQTPAVRIEKGK